MKRILTMLLAFVTVVTLSQAALAAAPQRIKSLHPDFGAYLYAAELNGASMSIDQLDDLAVEPGSELRIYMIGPGEDRSLFFDQEDKPIPPADVSVSRMRAAQLSITRSEQKNAKAIQSVDFGFSAKTSSLPSAAPYISVKFASDIVLKDVPFACTIGLTLAGEVQDQIELDLAGVLSPRLREVSVGDTAVDIYDGAVLVAEETIRNIQIDLGEGVTVTATLQKGERYYGVAILETDELMSTTAGATGEIVQVYTLDTVNLNKSTSKVQIDSETLLYVYDANGNYVGTTGTLLPFSEVYYATNKKISNFRP